MYNFQKQLKANCAALRLGNKKRGLSHGHRFGLRNRRLRSTLKSVVEPRFFKNLTV